MDHSNKLKRKMAKRRIKSDRFIENVEADARAPPLLLNPIDDVRTLSIAIPGSVIDNAQSVELRAFLAGQIARALVLFKVDEVVIFNDTNVPLKADAEEYTFGRKHCHCVVALATFLQFLESPPFIRRILLPSHKDLHLAEHLNPLPLKHKEEVNADSVFCEAIISKRPGPLGKSYARIGDGVPDVLIDRQLDSGTRVTLKLQQQLTNIKHRRGVVVSPLQPRADEGTYWGYQVRLAKDLTSVLSESPYKGGYDLTIGTSERGQNVDTVTLPEYKHVIVVFGGLRGLEDAVGNDEKIQTDDPSDLFQYYLNVCPNQGSRTIRTEEAILVTLATLQSKFG